MILEIQDGACGYSGGNLLYEGISLSVSQGEVLAILGPNGSGKTTLLKSMMNLMPFQKGRALIDGIDVKERKDFWKLVSYVPQARHVSSSLSGFDMVLLGCAPHLALSDKPKKEDKEKAYHALERLEITHLAEKHCDTMSGGELQMVLIARAIVSDPKMIVLDEPESNLDFRNQLMILETLRILTQKEQLICVINTHYPDHALKLSQKVLMIDKVGKCGLFGNTQTMITPQHLKLIFGVEVVVKTIEHQGLETQVVVPFLRRDET